MKINITITCDNAAFDESPSDEVARILKDAAQKFESIDYSIEEMNEVRLLDINGNRVGLITII